MSQNSSIPSSRNQNHVKLSANHTPTPWHVVPDCTSQTILCTIRGLDGLGYQCVAEDVTDKDAAFIVRAVNSHEALVAALDSIIKAYDRSKTAPSAPSAVAVIRAAVEPTRAILALVESLSTTEPQNSISEATGEQG